MANQKNRAEQMNGLGGGITALSGVGALSLGGAGSPPPLTGGAGGTWGGITTWPGPSTSPWPPQNHGGAANGHHQPTAMTSWAPGLAASPLSAAAAALTGPLSGIQIFHTGIRQWLINSCTSPMMIHKIIPSIDYN